MDSVLISNQGVVRILTINREKQLNALNKETIQSLSDALNESEKDNSVRVIIITGSGEKAFVAGADIKEFAHFDIESGKKLSGEGHRLLFDRIENLSKPCIAAVNGFALGGGLELAMACHIRIASRNAKLGLPEVSLGVIPGYGGTQRLAQLVGKGKAFEMIFTAGMIGADEALQWGLVNSVVESNELMETCLKLSGKISHNSQNAINQAIKAINAGFKVGENGFEAEINAFGECFGTPDFIEGTKAFLEKRKANFST